jgi:hypothetical protein
MQQGNTPIILMARPCRKVCIKGVFIAENISFVRSLAVLEPGRVASG